MRDENDYRNRDSSGLTMRQQANMVSRLTRGRQDWNINGNIMQKCVDTVEHVLDDETLHPMIRLKAVDAVIRMNQQNDSEANERAGEDGRVVIVLPTNGSEKIEQ